MKDKTWKNITGDKGSYFYRGTNMSLALQQEFNDGKIHGDSYNIYICTLEEDYQDINPVGKSIQELNLWEPGAEYGAGKAIHDGSASVTGGLTSQISTSVGFGGSLPLLMYFPESEVDAYEYNYRRPAQRGVSAWVYGSNADGELWHYSKDGSEQKVVGILDGEEIIDWGDGIVSNYANEREALVRDSYIDVTRSLQAVAVTIQQERGRKDVLREKYEEARELIPMNVPSLWVLALRGQVLGDFYDLSDELTLAYDGQQFYDSPNQIPGYLLGR